LTSKCTSAAQEGLL